MAEVDLIIGAFLLGAFLASLCIWGVAKYKLRVATRELQCLRKE